MTLEELAKQFDVRLNKLQEYEKQGLLDDALLTDGTKDYSKIQVNYIAKINDLFNAGFSSKDVKNYLEMNDERHQLNLLRKYRHKLVLVSHRIQKGIDDLDYMIASIQKNNRRGFNEEGTKCSNDVCCSDVSSSVWSQPS